MKNLPIGIQSLIELRRFNGIYVDKTRFVHDMVTTGKFYFFSRPRRFGKSLLVSTLKELFKGNQPLFEGLWIYDQWDWTQKHPIIHLSFDAMDYHSQTLADALDMELEEIAETYGIELTGESFKTKFKELLRKLSTLHGQVVLLIDEYDKPMLDFLEHDKKETAKVNQETMRSFYSVLKNADEHLRLVFITGITKFSKVSLFSHVNNLKDISLNEKYATLAGYTQQELEHYFDEYLIKCSEKLNLSRAELLEEMKIWYDGFSWDGVQQVYNPFGTLLFLDNQRFSNFWFSTGSPKFLIEQMRGRQFYKIEDLNVNELVFEKFDVDNPDLVSLLFQTGYLTVKKLGKLAGDYILDYPNKEVRDSMYQFLIDDLSKNHYRTNTRLTVYDMHEAFLRNDLPFVRTTLDGLLHDLPPEAYQNQTEGLYHGLVHIVFNYLGMFLQSEVASSQGYADAVVQTPADVYIFEFKFNKSAEEAMKQIHTRNYANKHRASGKKITGIGVNFDSQQRCIDGWVEEVL